jgi:hypothetical protein
MAGINNIDYREYSPRLKFRNNMENKEQNIGIENQSNLSELEQSLLGIILNLRHETDYLPDHYYEWMDKLIHKADCKDEASQPINSGWILCDDDMPELNTTVLILINDKNPDIDSLVNDDGDIHWNIYEDANVTHWMPLPSPPKP